MHAGKFSYLNKRNNKLKYQQFSAIHCSFAQKKTLNIVKIPYKLLTENGMCQIGHTNFYNLHIIYKIYIIFPKTKVCKIRQTIVVKYIMLESI